jgi:hypothetical protein
LDGERATIPEIRLQPLRTLTGQVHDRQGRPVTGARVWVPGGGPSTATNAEGRFALAGINPAKAVVLVEPSGFRLRGWVVDPSARDELGTLTVVRTGEDPGPVMKPLADPIPPAESRALADHLLGSYLRDEPPKTDDRARLAAISILGEFDADRALELLRDAGFRDDDFSYQSTRASLAEGLAEKDPPRAVALAEAIPIAATRAGALLGVARALPVSERGRKQALLERATTLLKNDPRQTPPGRHLGVVAGIAEQWLELGERDRAQQLVEEGKSVIASLPPANAATENHFLGQLARLEPDQAPERLRKLPDPKNSATSQLLYDAPAAVAVELATEHPAEAEKAFNVWDRVGIQWVTNMHAMRLARRLARVDPPRAGRFAAAQRGLAERALAWAYVALGLAESKRARAPEAVDQAIQEIDRLRESGPGPEQVMILTDVLLMYPTNPAAVILPVVEQAAPDRLADVFWRAVALHPRIEPDNKRQLHYSYVGFECMLLALRPRCGRRAPPADGCLPPLPCPREGPAE